MTPSTEPGPGEAAGLPAPVRRIAPLAVSGLGRQGRFTGYASVFGRPDLAADVIEHGAFRLSLERRGPEGVRMLYQHDPAEVIGRWIVIREDTHGLYVEGQLTPAPRALRRFMPICSTGRSTGCPSASAPCAPIARRAAGFAASWRPISGKSPSSPFRCCRRRGSAR
ncbi:hypothetical protein GGR23_002937 [Gellertiella hungarica]|uniref:Prohead serine protease domain-containing protein n=1 Tax=Gellertiella hungarica TaxID=1572859 RepID=A0A7W6J6K6_9HYPH|nr:hypothetical protein [Gellertiella hungarica]